MDQYFELKDQIAGVEWEPLLTLDGQKRKDMRPAFLNFINLGVNTEVLLIQLGGNIVGSMAVITEINDYKDGKSAWIYDFRLDYKLKSKWEAIVKEVNLRFLEKFEEMEVILAKWCLMRNDNELLHSVLKEQRFERLEYILIGFDFKKLFGI